MIRHEFYDVRSSKFWLNPAIELKSKDVHLLLEIKQF